MHSSLTSRTDHDYQPALAIKDLEGKNDITTENLLLKTNLKVITTTGASHKRYIAQNLERKS